MTKEENKKIYSSGDYRALTDKQRRIFRDVVAELDSRQMLRVTDVPVIASYARNAIISRLACEELEKHGLVLTETDNYRGEKRKENPAFSIYNRAQQAMERTAALLGLTPTGRKRLKGEEVPPKSDLDTFIEGLNGGPKA